MIAANEDVGVLRGVFHFLAPDPDAARPIDSLAIASGPATPVPGARPLGQPRRHRRARLRRRVDLGLATSCRTTWTRAMSGTHERAHPSG